MCIYVRDAGFKAHNANDPGAVPNSLADVTTTDSHQFSVVSTTWAHKYNDIHSKQLLQYGHTWYKLINLYTVYPIHDLGVTLHCWHVHFKC